LNLLTTGTSNIDVSADSSNVSKKISTLADAYNKLNDTLKQFNELCRDRGDSANRPLLGDCDRLRQLLLKLKQLSMEMYPQQPVITNR
jgi:flagellar capping protein FliD